MTKSAAERLARLVLATSCCDEQSKRAARNLARDVLNEAPRAARAELARLKGPRSPRPECPVEFGKCAAWTDGFNVGVAWAEPGTSERVAKLESELAEARRLAVTGQLGRIRFKQEIAPDECPQCHMTGQHKLQCSYRDLPPSPVQPQPQRDAALRDQSDMRREHGGFVERALLAETRAERLVAERDAAISERKFEFAGQNMTRAEQAEARLKEIKAALVWVFASDDYLELCRAIFMHGDNDGTSDGIISALLDAKKGAEG